jgi:DNA-binding response OmpR family regulator
MATIFLVHDGQESPIPRQQFLELAGHTVRLLKSGLELLRLLEDVRPDLIVLDVLLDGPNGFEVLTQLRASVPATEVPVVVCSGVYTPRVFQEAALAAGAQAYLVRPFELAELGEEVNQQLRVVQLQNAARASFGAKGAA